MNSLGKGEGIHKRIQAVSPSFFWQRENRMKRYSTLLFSAEFSLAEEQGLKKKLRKLFGKGRRRRKMSRKEL